MKLWKVHWRGGYVHITVYIQLCNWEVLLRIEVHMTHNGSFGKGEWSVNLCSIYSTENIHLQTDLLMFGNLAWIL
jgi:hypothetical protein